VKKGGAPRHGLKVFDTGGIYGPRAHVKLAPYYDAYGASRLQAIARAKQLASVQAAGVAAMQLVINNRGVIHYTQSALRMSGVRGGLVPPKFGHFEDCSSEATWIAFVMDQAARKFGGRFPDPNNLGYNGQGFTGTQVTHGRQVSAAAGPICRTFCFYGNISHVTVKKTMTRCMSMGSERGPLDENIWYRPVTTARVYPVILPP
jgi:hypothetical protein